MRRQLLPRVLGLLLLLSLPGLLSGCTTGRDSSEILYIILFGIDKAPNGKFVMTFQFEDAGAAKSEGGESDVKLVGKSISIESPNILSSLELLTSVLSLIPSFAHTHAIIFGEEAAKAGLYGAVSGIMRDHDIHVNTYILIVNDGTAKEFIEKNTPALVASPARYVEKQMALSEYSNFYVKANLREFYTRMKSNSAESYATLCGINSQENARKNKKDIDKLYAGEMPREGTLTPAEFLGTALFRQGKMVGKLNSDETRMLAILQGDITSFFLYLPDLLKPDEEMTFSLQPKNKCDFEVQLADGIPRIKVKAALYCSLTKIATDINYEDKKYRAQLEAYVAAEMTRRVKSMLDKTQLLGTDVVGFGYKARTLFRTYPEFMAIDWAELYKKAEITVETQVNLVRPGLMRRATPADREKYLEQLNNVK